MDLSQSVHIDNKNPIVERPTGNKTQRDGDKYVKGKTPRNEYSGERRKASPTKPKVAAPKVQPGHARNKTTKV